MPKQLKEIKGFHAGTVSSPDAQDIPIDSNTNSLDLDNYDSKGELKGRKGDEWYESGGFTKTDTAPNYASVKITLANNAGPDDYNTNYHHSYILLECISGSYYLWFDFSINNDPATIPHLNAQDKLSDRIAIKVDDNIDSTDNAHDAGTGNLSITDTNANLAEYIHTAINNAKSTGLISGITSTYTPGNTFLVLTSSKYGNFNLASSGQAGNIFNRITYSEIVTGQGIHGKPVDAAIIANKDKNTMVFYDEEYGVSRIEDLYSSSPSLKYGEYLGRSKRSTPLASIAKKNKETHIGLGTELNRTPKWAGFLNIGNQVYERDEFHTTNAELLLPGGEYASVSREFSQIINPSNISRYMYAIVKGQDRIHRINNDETDDDYGLIETSNPLGYTVNAICECKSDLTNGYIWAYTPGVNHDIYEQEGSSGSFLKIKVDDLSDNFIFDKVTLQLPLIAKIVFDTGTKPETGAMPELQGLEGVTTEDPEVYSICETKCLNTNGSGNRFMLWFMLCPRGHRIDEDGWAHTGQLSGEDRSTNPYYFTHARSMSDRNNSYLYSSGHANESGALIDSPNVQNLTFYDRSILTSSYETRYPKSGSDTGHVGNKYLDFEGHSQSDVRNNQYWSTNIGSNFTRYPWGNLYTTGIKTRPSKNTIKHYGAFLCNWHTRPYFHFKIDQNGQYDLGNSFAKWIDTSNPSTDHYHPHFIDIKYTEAGPVDRKLNKEGFYSYKDAICRVGLKHTSATYGGSYNLDPTICENGGLLYTREVTVPDHDATETYDGTTGEVTAGPYVVTSSGLFTAYNGTSGVCEGMKVVLGSYYPAETRIAKVVSADKIILTKPVNAGQSGITSHMTFSIGRYIEIPIDNSGDYNTALKVRRKIAIGIRDIFGEASLTNPYNHINKNITLAAYEGGGDSEGLTDTLYFLSAPYQVNKWSLTDTLPKASNGAAYAPETRIDNTHFQFSSQMVSKLDAGHPQGFGHSSQLSGGVFNKLNQSTQEDTYEHMGQRLLHDDLGDFSAHTPVTGSSSQCAWIKGITQTEGVVDTWDVISNSGSPWVINTTAGTMTLTSSSTTAALTSLNTSDGTYQFNTRLMDNTAYIVKIVIDTFTAGGGGGTKIQLRVGDSDLSSGITAAGTYYLALQTKDFSDDIKINGVSIGYFNNINSMEGTGNFSKYYPLQIIPDGTLSSVVISSVEFYMGSFATPPVELASQYNLSSINSTSKLLIRNPGVPCSSYSLVRTTNEYADGAIFTDSLNQEWSDNSIGGEVNTRFSPAAFSLQQYDNGSCHTERSHTVSFGMSIVPAGFTNEPEGQDANDQKFYWHDALYVEIDPTFDRNLYENGSSANASKKSRAYWGYNHERTISEGQSARIVAKDTDRTLSKYRLNMYSGHMFQVTATATPGINKYIGASRNMIDKTAPDITSFKGLQWIDDANDDWWGNTGGDGSEIVENGKTILNDDTQLNFYLSTATPGTTSDSSNRQIDSGDSVHLAHITSIIRSNNLDYSKFDFDWDTSKAISSTFANPHSIFSNSWNTPNDNTTDTVKSIGRKFIYSGWYGVDGASEERTITLIGSPGDAVTSSGLSRSRGGLSFIPDNDFQQIVYRDNENENSVPAITGEGKAIRFSIGMHAQVLDKFVNGGMDPYVSGVDDSGSSYQYKLKIIDRRASKKLIDIWFYYNSTFNGPMSELGWPDSGPGYLVGQEYIGQTGTLGQTNSGNSVVGYKIVNQLDTFIKSVTDGAINGSEFSALSKYTYKLSYLYDGYQESPLSVATWTHTVGSDSKAFLNVTFSLDFANPRLTHINLYRVSGISQDNDSLYRLAGSYSLASGWEEIEQNGLTMYQRTENDEGTSGATYEAINGISELITSTMVNYGLSTVLNDYLFVAQCYAIQIKGGENYLFRSKLGNFDQFDWSRDFLILPEYPTAMASFRNRLYVFSRTSTYIVNHNMQLEDTFKGSGCFDRQSVASTDQGICYAGDKGIYLIAGGLPQNISIPISDKYLADVDDGTFTKAVVGYHSETSSFIINTLQNKNYVYHAPTGRWDIWTTPYGGKMRVMFNGGRNELFSFDGNKDLLVKYAEDTANKKAWNWTSKRLTMDSDTQKKTFKKIHVKGFTSDKIQRIASSRPGDLTYTTKSSDIEGSSISYSLTGSNKKATWIIIDIANSTDDVDSIGIIYRTAPIK